MPRVLSFGDPIETERLALRRWHRGDLEALYAQQSDPEVARYLPRGVRSREEVERALAVRIASVRLATDNDELSLAVERREDGRVVGDLTLWLRSAESRQAEIGWVFDPDIHGHGYATEGARALIGFAFEAVGAHRVYARAEARNEPSIRLMGRLGMRREAHLHEVEIIEGEWWDKVVYAVLAGEWPALGAPAGS